MAATYLTKQKLGIAAIITTAAASIALTLFLGLRAMDRFATLDASWRSYNTHSSEVSIHLSKLQGHLGYGGFIHNFKNYVLRGERKYLEQLQENARAALSEIESLRDSLLAGEDKGFLADIEATVREYLSKKDELLSASSELDIRALDAIARVDDTAALEALRRLRERIETRSLWQAEMAATAFEEAKSGLRQATVVVALILAAASGMIFLLVRLGRANEELIQTIDYKDRLYDESPNALISVNGAGRIYKINRKAEELLGYTSEEMTGRFPDTLIPPGHDDDRLTLRERLLSDPLDIDRNDAGMHIVLSRKNGGEAKVHLGIRGVKGRSQPFFLLALTDITELTQLHEELTDAQRLAEAASVAKSRFLTSMSHEIRTPLNGILGMLQLIEDRDVSPEVAKRLAIAKESGLFLLTLINQVLDFARIEAGKIEPKKERFSLPALVNAMQSMFQIRAEMKGLSFTCDVTGSTDLYLYGDYDHIQQILFNLLGNAIKFTEIGSIGLLAKCETAGDGNTRHISFEISDTGPGIEADDLDNIFEEFRQTDVGIRQGGGTGLGLNISKRVAAAIGGELTVESEVGRGSTFRLSIEVEVAQDQEITASDGEEVSVPPLRILVAEDNDINQMITKALLEKDGHSVTVASDGAVAVDLVKRRPKGYDVILMDIQMPNMDGVQATVSIRQFVRDVEALPIIALTANAFKEQMEEYLAAGMQHVLTKPLQPAALRAALQRFHSKRLSGASGQNAPRAMPCERKPSALENPGDGLIDLGTIASLMTSLPPQTLNELLESAASHSAALVASYIGAERGSEEMGRFMHDLAGMLGNFGLTGACIKLNQIDHQIQTGEDASKNFAELETILATSWAAIRREFDADKA